MLKALRGKAGFASLWPVWLTIVAAISAQIIGLGLMGRPAFCICGATKVWSGDVLSPETSQLFVDWYSFTHIEHGLIFYFLGWLLLPRLSVTGRFLLAIAIEVGWELLENSPSFVEIYRRQALAIGYTGDTIVNSVADVGFMSLGYFIAALAPVWVSVALLVLIEGALMTSIRDSLALNLLNFIHPVDAVARWQSKAP
jgi:hypothetical protein